VAAGSANAQRRRACLVFFDETALSLTPNVRRSWAPVGQPPVLEHRFNWKKASMAAALCYGVRGGGAQLGFHLQPGNYNTGTLIQVLAELRRFLGGEKATLLWDGLPAHRSRAMQAWLHTQRHWLVVERLPSVCARAQPGRGPMVVAERQPAGQSRQPDPPGGGGAGRAGDRARPADATSCLLVSSPHWPIGLMTRQTNTQDPLTVVC
jgi:hypothetical protein